MSLEISVSKVDSITLVALKGRIIAGSAAESLVAKVQELVQAGEIQIILDLAQVTYLDSTGVGALIKAAAAPKLVGGNTKLLHLTRRITDVLQIARLSSGFDIYDNLEKAVASFPTQPPEPSSPETGA